MELKNGNRKSERVQGESIIGLRFMIKIVHTTLNTAFVTSASMFDWSKLNLAAQLHRAGDEYDVINNAPLKPILKAMALTNAINADIVYNTKNVIDTLVTQAAGAYHKMLTAFDVHFDSGIILKGSDEFIFTAKLNEGFFKLATMSTAESIVEIKPIYGVTKEYAIPHIRVDSIEASANDYDTPMRDNVTGMFFVNMSDKGYNEADRILDSVTIRSNELDVSMSFEELVADKNGYLPENLSYMRDQSFRLLLQTLTDFDEVKVKLALEETNVVTGDNYVVTFHSELASETYERQIKRDSKQLVEKSVAVVEETN